MSLYNDFNKVIRLRNYWPILCHSYAVIKEEPS